MPFFGDGTTSPVQPSPTQVSHSPTGVAHHATGIAGGHRQGASAKQPSTSGSAPPSSTAAPPGAAVGAPPGSMPVPMTGPPYPPMYAALGGIPAPIPDVPVNAVFLVLFLVAGIAHMKMFRQNKAKAHKFVFSAALFIFCMIRVISTSLRMAWSYREMDLQVGIAAQIFTAAGIVILYICNLFFTQRLLNARHPGLAFKMLVLRPGVVFTVISIFMVIIVVVQSFYTLNPHTHQVDRSIQLYALTYFTVIAFVPLLTVVLMHIVPRANDQVVKVPSGTFTSNAVILGIASGLLTLGAGWKTGALYRPPVLLPGTAWYLAKGPFYVFTFMIEFLIVLMYLVLRVDRRFYIPAPGQEQFESRSPTPLPAAAPAMTTATTAVASKATSKAPTGFNSPHDTVYSTASEKTTYEDKLPLFLQVILDVDPDTGKYRVGNNPTLTEMRRGKSKPT